MGRLLVLVLIILEDVRLQCRFSLVDLKAILSDPGLFSTVSQWFQSNCLVVYCALAINTSPHVHSCKYTGTFWNSRSNCKQLQQLSFISGIVLNFSWSFLVTGFLTCIILENLNGITLMYFYLILPSSINFWQFSGQLLTMAHLPDLVMEMFRLTVKALQQKLWDDLVIYKTTWWWLYDSDACSCPLVVSV